MMPLGDEDSPRSRTAIVTYGLILLNLIVFLLELRGGDSFVINWSFIPQRFLADPVRDSVTLFSSMFMHGGVAHIAGNMLYLWIFGDNVEEYFGRGRYLFFYLICGLAATFLQLWFTPNSTVPNLGASGAIAGVLGAYLFLFPQARIRVLVGNRIMLVPALLMIGFWFFLQLVSGMDALYSTTLERGGVAYMAHIGGFIAGLVLTLFFRRPSTP